MTSCKVSRLKLDQRWNLLRTDRLSVRTPRMETTPRWRRDQIWRASFDRVQLLRLQVNDRREEALCVGMKRFVKNVPDRAELDKLSSIENRNPITDLSDNPQIVRDEQERHVIRLLEVLKNVENLGLDDYIEGRCGLVSDEERRLQDQSERDHYSLGHPPG